MSLKRRTRLAIAAGAMMALTLAGAASAHPHTAGPKDQTLANGQNHGTYTGSGVWSGVSCGGDPAAYGLESAHHGPDAGTPGKADDGCYRTTGGVFPASLDDENPTID